MLAAGVPPEDVMWATNQNTDINGNWSGTVPFTGLIYSVLPRSVGDYVNNVSIAGSTITVNFKKLKGPLGITLGTLLSVTIFEDSPGIVNFDLIGSRPRT